MSMTWKKCGRRTGPCVVLRAVKAVDGFNDRVVPARVSGGGTRGLFDEREIAETVELDETDAVSGVQPHLMHDDEDVPF